MKCTECRSDLAVYGTLCARCRNLRVDAVMIKPWSPSDNQPCRERVPNIDLDKRELKEKLAEERAAERLLQETEAEGDEVGLDVVDEGEDTLTEEVG